MSFQFKGLDHQLFSAFYGLDAAALDERGIIPYIADSKPGYPCRVSLRDAEPGERLLILNFEHLPVASPYRAAHGCFLAAVEPL